MVRYFLGIDIGNTKSHALIVDDSGQAVSLSVGNPGNHEVLGVEGFVDALQFVTQDALKQAKLNPADISGAGFAIAGYDWLSDRPLMVSAIDTLELVNAPYEIVNDSVMGLIAGARQGWGVNVSAGTSSNCWGRDAHGNIGRITGEGIRFGEYGGGVELVWIAIQAVSRAWSLRGPETALSEAFVKHLGAASVSDLLEGIARGRFHVGATDAPVVFDVAAKGDAVATDLIDWISRELGNLAVGVIRQLKLETQEFEVVMAGSFYKGSAKIAPVMEQVIHEVAPKAQLVRLDAPPVVGAAMLGMEQAKVDFVPMRDRLIKSSAAMLSQYEMA